MRKMGGNIDAKSRAVMKESEADDRGSANTKNWREKEGPCFKWFLLGMIVVFNIVPGMLLTTSGVFYSAYTFIYHENSKAQIGGIVSIQIALGYGGGVVLNAPLKVYGCRPVAFIGGLILFLGFFSSAFMTSIYALYVTQGVLVGLGHSMLENSSFNMLQIYCPKAHRVVYTGIGLVGFNIGNFIGPILAQTLVSEFGIRGALLLFAAISAHVLPIALLFRPRRNRKFTEGVNGNDEISKGLTEMFRELCDFSIVKDPSYVLFSLGGGFLYRFMTFAFVQHFTRRALHHGVTSHTAALLLAIGYVCATIARILTAFVANLKCVSKKLCFTSGVAIGAVGMVVYCMVPNVKGIAAAAILQGISIGIANSIFPVVLVELQGVENFPKAIGLFYFQVGTAALVATPVTGLIFDLTQNYTYPFILAAGFASLATIFTFIVFIREKMKGRKDSLQTVKHADA